MVFRMEMLKKFLKESMAIIAGKQSEELVDLLDTHKHVNEFVIAKKLNLTINQTRNMLYKISDFGLVSSIRKKDKRKGWYTYFWKIEILKSLEFIKNDLVKKIENFEHQIKSREIKRFYICEKCHVEFNEENALFNNFTCPECGSILTIRDNTKLVNEMKRNVERLKKDLAFVQDEITKEGGILEKKKMREFKKERKEILKKKEAQKAKRKREKKKAQKNMPKKKPKKSKPIKKKKRR